MPKRLLALLLCCLLWPALGGAQPMDGGEALWVACDAGQPLRLTVRAQLTAARDLTAPSLVALQRWLQEATLEVGIAPDTEALALRLDEQPLLTLWQQGEALSLQGQRYQAQGQQPLQLLLGQEAAWRWPLAIGEVEALEAALVDALAVAAPPDAPLQKGRTLRAVGTARETRVIALSQAQGQALWPGLIQRLTKAAPRLTSLAPFDLLALRFEGDGELRQYLGAQGETLGWQYKGLLSLDGKDIRNATLLYARAAGQGLHLSLKLPAAKGRNNLDLQLTLTQSAAAAGPNWEGDLRLQHRLEGVQTQWRGSVRLRSAVKEGMRTLGGSLRLERTSPAPRQTLELKPQLRFEADGLDGQVQLIRRAGSAPLLDMLFTLRLHQGPLPVQEGAGEPIALHQMTPQALAAQREEAMQQLLSPLRKAVLQLPQAQRLSLIHDMGRTRRARSDALSAPLPTPDTPLYQVEDHPTEEETTP